MDRSLIAGVRIQTVRRMQLTDTDEGSIFNGLHAANHCSPPFATCNDRNMRSYPEPWPSATACQSSTHDFPTSFAKQYLSLYTYRSYSRLRNDSARYHLRYIRLAFPSILVRVGESQMKALGVYTRAAKTRYRTLTRATSRPTMASYGRYVIFCRYIAFNRIPRTLL